MSSDRVLSQEEIDALLAESNKGASSVDQFPDAADVAGVSSMEFAPPPPIPSAPVESERAPEQPTSNPPIPEPSHQSAPPVPQPLASQETVSATPQPKSSQPSGLDLSTQAMLNNMAAKMQNLDAAMERVIQLEKSLYETNNLVRQLQQENQSLTSQITLVSSRLEGVLANLKATLGYNAQKTFTCTHCRAKGEVAAQIKCTRCNKRNWWGWWPNKWRS